MKISVTFCQRRNMEKSNHTEKARSALEKADGISYDEVIQLSTKSTRRFMAITGACAFLNSSRSTIWVEYANTFDDSSMQSVAWIFFFDAILLGLFGLCFAAMGDYIGFDKAMNLKISFIAIGCILESCATNFTALVIGFLISQTATVYVSLAYISWILPQTHAKKQVSLLFAIAGSFYLSGSVFSGVLYKIFMNYRLIFIINSILMCVLLITSLVFVLNTQRKLHALQIEVCSRIKKTHDMETTEAAEQGMLGNELFPSYIDFEHKQNDDNISKPTTGFCQEISGYEWYKILSIIIERAIILRFESIFIVYYIPFMLQKYNKMGQKYNKETLILLCTLQIMCMSLGFIIVSGLISKFDHLLPKLYRHVDPNVCVIVLLVLLIGLHIPCLSDLLFHYYWTYTFFGGAIVSVVVLILEFLLLKVQPPKHAGKINGIKSLITNANRGIFLLFIGLYFTHTENAMIYGIIIGCVIVITLISVRCFIHLLCARITTKVPMDIE
eukprot:788854_1